MFTAPGRTLLRRLTRSHLHTQTPSSCRLSATHQKLFIFIFVLSGFASVNAFSGGQPVSARWSKIAVTSAFINHAALRSTQIGNDRQDARVICYEAETMHSELL